MKYRYLLTIILFPLVSFHLKAQPDLPDMGEVFIDSNVPRIDISIDPDTLEWLYEFENLESDQEFHATFVFDNGNIQDTIEDVGFRLRGNTSRYSAKKSFKVSFNTFDSGRKWYGLEKLNLNGEHNDPSIIRAKICWDILYEVGVPGARSNHVELYINNNYYGLYLNVEHIDEEFVDSRYGNKDGNLYKCLWPADLNYLGSNPDNYKLTNNDRRVYDLKTNVSDDDYTDLAEFIEILNNTPDDEFYCKLEEVFNVQDYLKIIAVDIFTSNWDGYIYNKNNFYLYHNTETGKFEYINYDLDNTFGITWPSVDWGTRNIYNWEDGERPLYTRIMNDPVYRDQFSFYMEMLLNNIIDQNLIDRINVLKNQNIPFVSADPYYPLDYGFSIEDYINSFDESLGMHVDYGIFPFIDTRKSSALSQLEAFEIFPVINYIKNNNPMPGEELKIRAFIDVDNLVPNISLVYAESSGSTTEAEMYDDGNHWDNEAGDGIYGCILPEVELNTSITYQVKAQFPQGQETILPCEPVFIERIESNDPLLYINEFMASNTNTIADEYGEYDDWLEIYNADDEAVWLGDKFLSDNLENQDKWQLPDVMLQPQEFILIWADDDNEQGENHTNFKLDADGEEIGIFDSESTGYFLLDSVSFGEQSSDMSLARQPDGTDNWVYFTNTTPGYSNLYGNVTDGVKVDDAPFFYPNPAWKGIIYFENKFSIKIFGIDGRILLDMKNIRELDVSGMDRGLYLIVTDSGKHGKLLIR